MDSCSEPSTLVFTLALFFAVNVCAASRTETYPNSKKLSTRTDDDQQSARYYYPSLNSPEKRIDEVPWYFNSPRSPPIENDFPEDQTESNSLNPGRNSNGIVSPISDNERTSESYTRTVYLGKPAPESKYVHLKDNLQFHLAPDYQLGSSHYDFPLGIPHDYPYPLLSSGYHLVPKYPLQPCITDSVLGDYPHPPLVHHNKYSIVPEEDLEQSDNTVNSDKPINHGDNGRRLYDINIFITPYCHHDQDSDYDDGSEIHKPLVNEDNLKVTVNDHDDYDNWSSEEEPSWIKNIRTPSLDKHDNGEDQTRKDVPPSKNRQEVDQEVWRSDNYPSPKNRQDSGNLGSIRSQIPRPQVLNEQEYYSPKVPVNNQTDKPSKTNEVQKRPRVNDDLAGNRYNPPSIRDRGPSKEVSQGVQKNRNHTRQLKIDPEKSVKVEMKEVPVQNINTVNVQDKPKYSPSMRAPPQNTERNGKLRTPSSKREIPVQAHLINLSFP